MTTALGIAATTAVLQQILLDGLAALKIGDLLGDTPTVSVLAPELIKSDAQTSQLNLFLYNQLRNPGWANLDLPSRDARGERVSNPALALDLCILVSAYGVADLHAEVLLGAAMQILHDTPALGREAIRNALKPSPAKPNLPKELEAAGLADQLEQLRITPLNLTIDDVSRLWSALQVPSRQSAAYMISVLLMRSRRSSRAPLPVSGRNVYVVPFKQPRIDVVGAAQGVGVPILPSGKVRVSGANLKHTDLRLSVDGLDVTAGLSRVEDDLLEFVFLLPPDPPSLPAGLHAGVCILLVSHPQFMGTPPVAHTAVESNPAAFVLNPEANFAVAPGATSKVVDGVAYKAGSVDIQCSPPIGVRQRVRLLLNEKNPPSDRPARAYSFAAPDGNGVAAPAQETPNLTVQYSDVAAGRYLVRLQVDAGISPLSVDADGVFAGPEVQP